MGDLAQDVTLAPLEPKPDEALDAILAAAAAAAAAATPLRGISAYLCDLHSMRCGQWRADADIYPASVIKVPIMAEAFRQYECGALEPGDRVIVTSSNQTTTAESTPFVPGYAATVAELVELMITHSDNIATNQLIDLLPRERVTAYMRQCGLPTFLLGRKLSGSEPLIEDPEMLGRNRLPAAEIGRLLLLIACDAVPGAEGQREILARCLHNDKLASGLRPGDVLMHKTGETSNVSHDAGILTTAEGKRYLVVLYCEVEPKTDGSDATHANPSMVLWMRTVREHL